MRHHLLTLLCFALAGTDIAAGEHDLAAPCVPGVSFWSLLGAVDVGYADGRLRIDKLYAVCLPQPKVASESNYAYSPDEGGKLTTLVKTASGQTVDTYVWYAENISGLWELSNYKVLGGLVKPLEAGQYALEFQADGTMFYRFPFAVVTAPNDDPYQPAGTRYFIEGPWNTYGNIFYQRNDPESSLRFTTWVQDKAAHAPQKTMPYTAQLLRADKVIGQDSGELHAGLQWRELEIYFQVPGGDAGAHIKAAQLLHDDGVYHVRLSIDGKPYGTYTFTVGGGKFELQGLQRDNIAPAGRIVDYLYGGRYRSWWIPRDSAKISG